MKSISELCGVGGMDLWHSIQAAWERGGLPVPAGATPDELTEFERRYRVTLPPPMRQYFLVADGSGDMGSDYFTFWALREVKLVSEELTSPCHTDRYDCPRCFVFADTCSGRGLTRSTLGEDGADDGPVYLLGGAKQGKLVIASSFLEFMQKYAAHPESLL